MGLMALWLFLPRSVQAMVITGSYWPAELYSNEIVDVRVQHDNKPCVYVVAERDNPTSTQVCAVTTAWGQIAEDGSIRFTGQSSFWQPQLSNGMQVLPVGKTDRLYVSVPVGSGGQFSVGYFVADAVSKLELGDMAALKDETPTIIGYNQVVFYQDTRQTTTIVHDFIWDTVGFSPNGAWMVGAVRTTQGSGFCESVEPASYCDFGVYKDLYVRVQLYDGAAGGFGTSDNRMVDGLTFSISNDGEAVAISGWNFWKLNLYLFPYGAFLETRYFGIGGERLHTFDDRGVGGQYVSNAFFSEDGRYLGYNVQHSGRTDLMRLWPASGRQPAALERYIALGDSFSSGEGVYTYRAETNFYKNANDYNLCHQSPLSYGYLVSAAVMPDWFGSVACSGAKMEDVVYKGSKYWEDSPQAKGWSYGDQRVQIKIENSLLPGYIDQKTIVQKLKPTVATVSVGGNDVGFADIVKACVLDKIMKPYISKSGTIIPRTCYQTRDQREVLANSVEAQIPQLTKTLQAIRGSMAGEQRLYVVGYPQAISPAYTPRCDIGTPVAWNERQFLVNFTDYLNEAVRLAAINAGVVYVDMSSAFNEGDTDYRLCGNQGQSAMNDVERNTASVRRPGQFVNQESFHPTLLGQILMTRQIRKQTNDLTRPMDDLLTEDQWFTTIDSEYRERLVGDAKKDVSKTATMQEITLASTLYKNATKNTVRVVQHDAVGSARAVLFSEPIELGSLEVGPEGIITGDIIIPDDVPTGYHQLHIIYTTVDGAEKDVYQYVFVGEKQGDLNGNNLPDNQESCVFDAIDGVDMNGDGRINVCAVNLSIQANNASAETVQPQQNQSSHSDGQTAQVPESSQIASLPGNNEDVLLATGAITPAEVALVSEARAQKMVTTKNMSDAPSISFGIIHPTTTLSSMWQADTADEKVVPRQAVQDQLVRQKVSQQKILQSPAKVTARGFSARWMIVVIFAVCTAGLLGIVLTIRRKNLV